MDLLPQQHKEMIDLMTGLALEVLGVILAAGTGESVRACVVGVYEWRLATSLSFLYT